MPSTSKTQQRLMGVAYAVKKGDMQISDVDADYRDKVKDLVDGMTLKQLKDFAETKHEGLPDKVEDNLQLGDVGGMGPVKLPTATELGSGDVPAGQGDAEEEYKKKRKKMKHLKNFESFVNESLNESHFKVGDRVECIDSGMTGEVIGLDKEDGAEDEKYYTVKREDDKEVKYSPAELRLVESKVNEGITFQELVDKYKDNPYGIGADSIEYVESKNWGNSLVLRFEDNYGRKEAEAELKKMGIKAKMMSKSTADKAFKYRYELTVNESKVNEEYVELPSIDVPSTDLIEAFKQWYKDTADNWEDFKENMMEDSVDEAAKNAQMEILANLSNEMNLVIKDRKFKVRMDLK